MNALGRYNPVGVRYLWTRLKKLHDGILRRLRLLALICLVQLRKLRNEIGVSRVRSSYRVLRLCLRFLLTHLRPKFVEPLVQLLRVVFVRILHKSVQRLL